MKQLRMVALFLLMAVLFGGCATRTPATPVQTTAAAVATTASATSQPTATAAATLEAWATPTATLSPTATATPEPTPTATPEPSPSATPDGPAVLGIYQRVGGSEYHRLPQWDKRWVKGVDICDLYVFASGEDTLKDGNYNRLFYQCWNSFPNAQAYKLGYHVKFTLKTGEAVDLWIRSPKDAPKDPKKYFYQFVEVYMYDSLKPKDGPKRMHLVESAMKPDTLITSIKLTCGSRIAEVTDITLGVFAYRGDADFDADGKYIGPVIYEIPVVNTAK